MISATMIMAGQYDRDAREACKQLKYIWRVPEERNALTGFWCERYMTEHYYSLTSCFRLLQFFLNPPSLSFA